MKHLRHYERMVDVMEELVRLARDLHRLSGRPIQRASRECRSVLETGQPARRLIDRWQPRSTTAAMLGDAQKLVFGVKRNGDRGFA